MNINKSELKSEIVWDGVVLQKGEKKVKVKLEGDRVEETPTDSFSEGAMKGLGFFLTGPAYPFVAGALRGYICYTKTKKTAENLGETDDWKKAKAGFKGALVGGTKGFVHGILDYMVLKGLTASAIALIGTNPGGLLLPIVLGGVYNLVKDAIRK
jgi:hypothetical protein